MTGNNRHCRDTCTEVRGCSGLRFCLCLPGWCRRWRRERMNSGPSNQICSRKTVTSQVGVTSSVFKRPFSSTATWVCKPSHDMAPSGLRGELRAEEEKLREKERERSDLEETVEVLRKELSKTEQARKDASIKVWIRSRSVDVIVFVQRWNNWLIFRLHLWSCRRVSWSRS